MTVPIRRRDAGPEYQAQGVVAEHECECGSCCTFECEACGLRWDSPPNLPKCECGSLWVRWVNYEVWRSSHDSWSNPSENPDRSSSSR